MPAARPGRPLRVAVLGARGRMGSEACRAVEGAPDLELVARVDGPGQLDRLTAADTDVAVDLTRPDAVLDNVLFCVGHGISAVVGTSGLGAGELAAIERALGAVPDGQRPVGVLVAPNFALGAVLMMRFAAQAAPWFESVEIVEMHHPDKADAPSGTARRTAELVARARRDAGVPLAPDATVAGPDGPPAARGEAVDGVPVHAVRLRGLVAHQEVLLGGPGETLTLRHDSLDRVSFMPGVLLAVRSVGSLPGLTVGLEHVLDLGPGPAASTPDATR